MKQRLILFALFAVVAGFFISCDDTKTYAEQLQEEKASINAFMKLRGYTLTKVIPDTIPWPDGVFYKTASGMYVHVLDTGNYFVDTIPLNTVISLRSMEVSMEDDTIYSTLNASGYPTEILYGNVSTSNTTSDCKAWHEALDYVGDEGHVQIIAPADIGLSYNTSSAALTARFYELRYKFWN